MSRLILNNLTKLKFVVKPALSTKQEPFTPESLKAALTFLREAYVFSDYMYDIEQPLICRYPFALKMAVVPVLSLRALEKRLHLKEVEKLRFSELIVRDTLYFSGGASILGQGLCDFSENTSFSSFVLEECPIKIPFRIPSAWRSRYCKDKDAVFSAAGFRALGYRSERYKPRFILEPPTANAKLDALLSLITPFRVTLLWEYDPEVDAGFFLGEVSYEQVQLFLNPENGLQSQDVFIHNLCLAQQKDHLDECPMTPELELILQSAAQYLRARRRLRYVFHQLDCPNYRKLSITELCGAAAALSEHLYL